MEPFIWQCFTYVPIFIALPIFVASHTCAAGSYAAFL